MLQYTYLTNGDVQVTSNTSDELLKELCSQYQSDMTYVPYTFVSRSMSSSTTRLNVRNKTNNVLMVNPACDVYEVSPITRKIVSRDAESFFAEFTRQVDDGFVYSHGSANLVYGSYSAVMNKATCNQISQETLIPTISTFDMSIALSLQTKEEVVVYCEQFGIQVDGRKSLPKIQNWLKAQQSL